MEQKLRPRRWSDNWLVSTKGRDKNEQIYNWPNAYSILYDFRQYQKRTDDLHAYLVAQGLKVAEDSREPTPCVNGNEIMNPRWKILDFEYIGHRFSSWVLIIWRVVYYQRYVHKIFLSLSIVLAGRDAMVIPGSRYYSLSTSDDSDIIHELK